ncbi:hypothetical protein BC835DRAFT_1412640 [Cytidiella melzeri]|nr:hypothetical protein BC835DRAFT_1412640 [Cytidiella melzeri]
MAATTAATTAVDPKDNPKIRRILTVIVAISHTWLIDKTKAKYMLAIVIAECCYGIGIAARYGLHSDPDSHGIYILEYLFITLAPCGFIAMEYVILGRLVHCLNGDKHLLIRPSRVTKVVFVASDIITFLIQASGGAIAVSSRTDINNVRLDEHNDSGPLTAKEIFFWVLDFVPLLVAISPYIPFWSERFIGRDGGLEKEHQYGSGVMFQTMHGESTQSICIRIAGVVHG